MTVIAVGALTLDGVVLGLIGLWTGGLILLLLGGLILALALGAVVLWKHQLKRLEELAAAREAMRAAARALREAGRTFEG